MQARYDVRDPVVFHIAGPGAVASANSAGSLKLPQFSLWDTVVIYQHKKKDTESLSMTGQRRLNKRTRNLNAMIRTGEKGLRIRAAA